MQSLPEPYKSLFDAMLSEHGSYAVPGLVRQGADLSFCHPNTGQTALYTATRADYVLAVEALLKHGANPNQRMNYRSPIDGHVADQRTSLHYALSGSAADALIKSGADVDAADAEGFTPLMCAAYDGHVEVAKSLLNAGASPAPRHQPLGKLKGRTARECAEAKLDLIHRIIQERKLIFSDLRLRKYEKIRTLLAAVEKF